MLKEDPVLKKPLIFFLIIVCVFSGCLSLSEGPAGPQNKSFGSFTTPEGWVEVRPWRRGKKYFYADIISKYMDRPTNISVEMGTNRYSVDEHDMFRYAILRQLYMQTTSEKIYGFGSFTDNGDPYYKFTVEDENKIPKVKTVQYYIVGEKRHILIHLTDHYNENVVNAEEVALEIANSFKWAD
jgi:hypothetical protein